MLRLHLRAACRRESSDVEERSLTEPGTERAKPSEAKSGRAAQIARRLAVVALLLALASGVALFAALYTADAAFIAGALSKLLGRHVEIGRVTFHFGRRLELELEQVRVADHPGDRPMLEVGRARGVQAWPRLLAGQYVPLDWTLDAPVLRIHTDVTGPIDLSALPRLGLHVTDGRVDVTTAAGEAWSLSGLQLDARRARFGTRVEGEGSARLSRGETPVTELALHFSAARDHADLKGSVAALDLAALPKTAVTPRGSGEGGFDLTVSQGGAVHGKVHLEVQRFALRIPKLSGPIAPATARIAADVDWRPGLLALDLHPLELDDLVVSGPLRVSTARNGRFVADLSLAPFEPAHRERVNALTFLALRFASWARVKTRIEAGVVEDIHFALDVPSAAVAESLSYDAPLAPDAFVLELRVRDGTYRPKPDDSALEHLQGELEIRGEVMEIRHMRMIHEGEPLPEINVQLTGMHRLVHLPDAEDHVAGGPGVDLDGLAPLAAALRAGEGQAREPTVLHFQDLAIRMPQFMLPLREAEGSLRFPDGGIAADPVEGVLGGAPARLSARWNRAADRVDVDVQYLEGVAPGGPITGPTWLSAKVEFDKLDLPDWPLDEVSARLGAEGARVTLSALRARLAGGKLGGSGQLDLSLADRAPFDLEFAVFGFDPLPLCTTFSLPPESVTGRGEARVHISGALRPGGDFATEGTLATKLRLKDGTVARLPALVAIARLPSLSGVTGLVGKPLPYKTVELDLALANGKLGFADGKLLGPQLRMLANGEIDFNTPERQTDFVIALLFLQTLDRMLDQVPFVRNVVLGEDKNLIAVYLRLQGPRDNLTVTPMAPQTVQSVVGFTSSAVMSGVRRLGRLFRPGAESGAVATPAPSSPKP